MIRTLLWLLGGVLLGGIIHLAVILVLPGFSSRDVWTKVTALEADNRAVVLPPVLAGMPNPLGLDPEVSYAVCQLDLSQGPGIVRGTMPEAFWSLAVFNRAGVVTYSTTNRDGIGRTLDLGLFNAAQTRLLAQQEFDVAEGLLIVESRDNEVFVLIRLAPPHAVMRGRYEAALSAISCDNLQ